MTTVQAITGKTLIEWYRDMVYRVKDGFKVRDNYWEHICTYQNTRELYGQYQKWRDMKSLGGEYLNR